MDYVGDYPEGQVGFSHGWGWCPLLWSGSSGAFVAVGGHDHYCGIVGHHNDGKFRRSWPGAVRRTFGKNKGQIYKTTSGIRRRKVLAVHTVEVRVLDGKEMIAYRKVSVNMHTSV